MLGDVTHTHTLPTPSLLQVTQPPWSDWGEERRGLICAKAKALRSLASGATSAEGAGGKGGVN